MNFFSFRTLLQSSTFVVSALLASQSAAEAPDDTYLQCTPYLIAIETTWKQKLRNWERDGVDQVMIGSVRLVPDKAAGYPDLEHQAEAHPDRITFSDFGDFSIDRVEMRLKYSNALEQIAAINEGANADIPDYSYAACFRMSKSEMKAKIEAHNEKLGGVKF